MAKTTFVKIVFIQIVVAVLASSIARVGAFNAPQPLPVTLPVQEKVEPAELAATSKDAPVLRLIQALNEGLLKSPQVAAARAQLDITKALYAAATELPNPALTRDEGAIAEQTTRFGVQTTYVMPWKIAFKLLNARRQVQQSKLEILSTLWLLRSQIRKAYTEVVVAQETYQTVTDLYKLSDELLQVAQKRYLAGDVPELDVLKARLASSQLSIDLNQGARRVIRAKQLLNTILGSSPDRPIAVPRMPPFKLKAQTAEFLPDFSQNMLPMQNLINQALNNRLELKIIRQQIAVSNASLYQAVGNIIPDPQVATGSSRSGNPPGGPKLTGFFVSLNIELPILAHSQGDIARLKATIRQLYTQVHAQENQVVQDVASAYNNLLAAREKIRSYQEHVLTDSEDVTRLAWRSYEVGQSDITATLAAQEANEQIRSQYLEAVQAYQQAFTDLEQAVGEPLQY